MASIISVDNIRATGTSTNAITIDSSNNLGDITMNAEGGTGTLSVRQGVAKAWFNANCDVATYVNRDSFNISSIPESAAGDFRETYTNSMSNTNYSVTTSYDLHNNSGAYNSSLQAEEFLAASTDYRAWYGTGGGSRDTDICCGHIMGDLA